MSDRATKSQKHRAELEAATKARANDPLPDPGVTRRFQAWSDALLRLMAESLRTAHEGEWLSEWRGRLGGFR